MLLAGKNAVITGTNRGIGQELVRVFAENGANIRACARKKTEEFESFCSEVSEKNGVIVTPLYFDLLEEKDMVLAVKEIKASGRSTDILVNNAGVTYDALFRMTTAAKLEEMMRVNFIAPFIFSQYISKLMIRQGSGNIINFSSTSGLVVNPGRSAYSASKAAVISASRVMAAELSNHGIRVNVIAPGMTETDMVIGHMPESEIKETIERTMLKRMAKPVDIANAVLFLASDLSGYMTGQVIRADGGLM